MTNSNYGYGTDASQQPMREEVSFAVPASKCGIVIGRGGETIKLINQQSGAFCEMDRSAINPPSEKMFKMKGTSEQIEHARQLISEKIGVEISILSTRPISGVGNNGGGGGGGGGGQNTGQPNNYGMQGQNPANMYGQQQQQWGYQQQMWDQSQQQGVAVNATGQPDYSAQWIEYYKSIGLHREAEMIEQQLKMKQTTGQAVPMPSANGNAQMVVPSAAQQQQQQAQNPAAAAGQNDYSKQWAEYYRSIGKIEEAEAIESQIKGVKVRIAFSLESEFFFNIKNRKKNNIIFSQFHSQSLPDNHHRIWAKILMHHHQLGVEILQLPDNRLWQVITIHNMHSITLVRQQIKMRTVTLSRTEHMAIMAHRNHLDQANHSQTTKID